MWTSGQALCSTPLPLTCREGTLRIIRKHLAAGAIFAALAIACGGDHPTEPDNSVARIEITPAAPISLSSGSTTTLTAVAYTRDNRALGNAGITWSSSSPGVASIADGVVTARLVGSALITAASGGISATGVTVTVTPGTASQLAIRTQPNGASSGLPFRTQPAVEIHDAAGNLVTTAGQTVTASLATGAGTLTGIAVATAVNGVASFTNLGLTGLIGPRTLTFGSPGLSPATSVSFNLVAGDAATLVMRTQPLAGTAYAAFRTPAAVELRDGAGNLANSSATVTASLASGDGTLGGNTSVAAIAGVATFATLTVNGSAGTRTLQFSSPNVTPVTSASFDVADAPPAVITLSSAAPSLRMVFGPSTAYLDVAITNGGVFPLSNLAVQSVNYDPAASSGWLATSFPSGTTAPATLRLTATGTSLAVGTYRATVVLSGTGAATTTSLTVTLTVIPAYVNAYGTAANKVSLVGIGSTFSPGLVTTDINSGSVVANDPNVTYTSRIPSIATVDASGQITGVAPGEAWIVATSAVYNADSVLVIVPRSSGVILLTDLTSFNSQVGDVVTVKVLVDTRGASLGAATVTFSWSPWVGTSPVFGSLRLVSTNTSASPMSVVTSYDPTLDILRITGASVSGVSGVVELATLTLRVSAPAKNVLFVNAVELVGSDLSNLLPSATVTQYPMISK